MGSVFDYSYGRVGGTNASHLDAVKNAGAEGICRYQSFDGYPKNLSKQEYDYARSIGLSVAVVWETTASMMLRGAEGGRNDSYFANKQLDEIGFDGEDLFYAADFDVYLQHYGKMQDYLASCGGRTPQIYGEYDVIEHFVGGGFCRLGWQCAAWSGPGTGTGGSIDNRRVSAHACLFQRVGYVMWNTCDTNDILKEYWGQVGDRWGISQPKKVENRSLVEVITHKNEELPVSFAYKFDNHDTIWKTETRQTGGVVSGDSAADSDTEPERSLQQWYIPIGGPDDVRAMMNSGEIGGVRLLGVGQDKDGVPEDIHAQWDSAFKEAFDNGRVIGA